MYFRCTLIIPHFQQRCKYLNGFCFLFQKQETPNDRFLAKLENVPIEYDGTELVKEGEGNITNKPYKVYGKDTTKSSDDIYVYKHKGKNLAVRYASNIDSYGIVGESEGSNIYVFNYNGKRINMWHGYYKQISETYRTFCSWLEEEKDERMSYTAYLTFKNQDKILFDDNCEIAIENEKYKVRYYCSLMNCKYIITENEIFIIVYYYLDSFENPLSFGTKKYRFPSVLFKYDIENEKLLFCNYSKLSSGYRRPDIKLKTETSNEEIS